MGDLAGMSAARIARAIREREVSSEEVVVAHLDRIAAVNPHLNAVVHLTPEAALESARRADRKLAAGERVGPLHGVPMTIKDSLDTADAVSTGGTKGRAGFVPRADAAVAARLRAAGAILLGKTNTPELTMAYETDNLLHGRTNNPFDLSLTAGGSSGGAAAIVAAGGSPFDIGSDTGGSIRVPAHFCGIAGLKPTAGRVSNAGHILPPGNAIDEMTMLGPMARTVGDLELIFSVVADAVPPDNAGARLSDLRVAFFTDNGIVSPTSEIAECVRNAASHLAEAGCPVTEARPDAVRDSFELTLGLWTSDGGDGFAAQLAAHGTDELHPFMETVMGVCRAGRKTEAETAQLRERWRCFREDMRHFMESYDLIVSPVCPFAAVPHGQTFAGDCFPGFSYTMTHNLTGWPAAVIRAGTTATGLPIGVQIAGRPWEEAAVLAAARWLERSFGRWPEPPM
jgi:amidase